MAENRGVRMQAGRLELYFDLKKRGYLPSHIERMGGPSRKWIKGFEAKPGEPEYDSMTQKRRDEVEKLRDAWEQRQGRLEIEEAAEVIPLDKLAERPARALNDFEFFRAVYMGNVSIPWHVEAAGVVRDAVESSGRQFICMNVFPGSGKTTLMRDTVCWQIVRRRNLRCMWGSSGSRAAAGNTRAVRQMLERTAPVKRDTDLIAKGRAMDAESTLALDYGKFKPTAGSEIWQAEQFTVLQHDQIPVHEKEATMTAFGRDSQVIGWRVDLSVWDDLATNKNMRTQESRDDIEDWFIQEAEARLEPDGVMLLVGQRLHGDDIYWRRLQERLQSEFDIDTEVLDETQAPQKYTHIVYPAHDDDKCVDPGGDLRGKPTDPHHPDNARPWPDGCLLDPVRMPWYGQGGLLMMQQNNPRMMDLTYQQKDVSEVDVLVPKVYVNGGIDPADGTLCPGCWDRDRSICELPHGLTGPLVSFATADPSPTKMWALQWWIWQIPTDTLWLMDTERRSMDAPDFLDFYADRQIHAGLMEDWQQRSIDAGYPIKYWIVENNAAQRFMLQYNHMRTWMAKRQVNVLPHTTGQNKADKDLGIGVLSSWFKFGKVRLPGKQGDLLSSRAHSTKLVSEVTRYPEGGTDDQVMAMWFGVFNLDRMRPASRDEKPAPRPTWLADTVGGIRL